MARSAAVGSSRLDIALARMFRPDELRGSTAGVRRPAIVAAVWSDPEAVRRANYCCQGQSRPGLGAETRLRFGLAVVIEGAAEVLVTVLERMPSGRLSRLCVSAGRDPGSDVGSERLVDLSLDAWTRLRRTPSDCSPRQEPRGHVGHGGSQAKRPDGHQW